MKNLLLTRIISFVNYLQTIIRENYFISALNTNAIFAIIYNEWSEEYNIYGYQIIDQQIWIGCGTQNLIDLACFTPIKNQSIYTQYIFWEQCTSNYTIISGFFAGCTSFEALMESTLQCLHDIICLTAIVSKFPNFQQVHTCI